MNISNNLIDQRKKRNFPETTTGAAFPLLFSFFYLYSLRKKISKKEKFLHEMRASEKRNQYGRSHLSQITH